MFFIRFTKSPKKDLERGTSYDIWEEEGLEGLCGYVCKMYEQTGEFEDRAKKLATWNAAGYAEATDGEYAVFEGEKVADGMDGVIFKPTAVVETENAFDPLNISIS